MEDLNTITNKGEVIAHHVWDRINKKWFIIFEKGLSEEELEEYEKRITKKAHELNLEVEFRNGTEKNKTI